MGLPHFHNPELPGTSIMNSVTVKTCICNNYIQQTMKYKNPVRYGYNGEILEIKKVSFDFFVLLAWSFQQGVSTCIVAQDFPFEETFRKTKIFI